jgi:cytochrome c5
MVAFALIVLLTQAAPLSRVLTQARAAVKVSVLAAASVGFAHAAQADLSAGKLLFDKKCAACHAGGQTLIPPFGANDLSAKALKENGYGSKDELVALISKGKRIMPAFGAEAPPYARFDDAQLSDVADYVIKQAADGWK